MKKFFAIVLSAILCLSCMVFVVSAEENDILANAPVNYTPWIDFTDWTETELAAFNKSGTDNGSDTPWTATASIDGNGLLTIETTNTGWAGSYFPGTSLATYDENGEVATKFPGTTIQYTENGTFVGKTTQESGICFWVDLSGWTNPHRVDDSGNPLVAVYFNDLDYTVEGKTNGSTTYVAEVAVESGYVGWVSVPFSNCRSGEWGSPEANNMVDMNRVDWFAVLTNAPNGENTFKIGYVGFYGEDFGGSKYRYSVEKPENAVAVMDFTKANGTWIDKGWTYESDYYVGAIDTEKGEFVFTHKQDLILGEMWWGAGSFVGNTMDLDTDEDGNVTGFLFDESIKADFSDYKLPEDMSQAGLYFYVDLSDLADNGLLTDPWYDGVLPFALCFVEQDFTAEGEMKAANDKATKSCWGPKAGAGDVSGYLDRLSLPLGYKGYAYIPFSMLTPKDGWHEADDDNQINLQLIRGFLIDFNETVANSKNDTATWTIGEIGFYGLERVVGDEDDNNNNDNNDNSDNSDIGDDEKPNDKEEDKDETNPDTGVIDMTGVALAAVVALGAIVCFRKRTDLF